MLFVVVACIKFLAILNIYFIHKQDKTYIGEELLDYLLVRFVYNWTEKISELSNNWDSYGQLKK